MTFAPTLAYHDGLREAPGRSTTETFELGPYQADPANIPASPEPGELPDSRLPETARRRCKLLAWRAAETMNVDSLMFLAAAIEVEAARKSAEEARS